MTQLREKAAAFALAAHGDQMYGDKPYEVHLRAVAAHVAAYGEEAVAIGLLHDVVEDTDVSVDDVRREFGDFVAACVCLLTDETGRDRAQRKRKTYARMAQASGRRELALVVKVADRLANVEACTADGNRELLAMYRAEQPAFSAAARRDGLCDELWSQLDAMLEAARNA